MHKQHNPRKILLVKDHAQKRFYARTMVSAFGHFEVGFKRMINQAIFCMSLYVAVNFT